MGADLIGSGLDVEHFFPLVISPWKCLGFPDKTRSLARTPPRWPSTTLPSANGISALAVDFRLFCHAGTAVSWCTKGVTDCDGDQLH